MAGPVSRRHRTLHFQTLEPRALLAVVGDFDVNGVVDFQDYAVWKSEFSQSGFELRSDHTNDGIVDIADYTLWRDLLGQTSAASGSAVSPTVAEAVRNQLLAGVTEIALSGAPGQIAVFDPPGAAAGEGAFGVMHDGDYRPMVAAAIWGSGKIVAFGHNGYVNFGGLAGQLDTGQFYLNSVAWTTESAGTGAVIVTSSSSTRDWLVSQGFTNVSHRNDWQNYLAGADLLIAEIGPGTTAAQQQALRSFVQGGGGLITGGTGWGYQQGGTNLVTMSGNVVLREAGLSWASGFRSGTSDATQHSTELSNASQALAFAQQVWAGGNGTVAQKEEAGRALQTVLSVLPSDHALAIAINDAFADRAANIFATPASPVSDVLDQAVLTWESNLLAATPVSQVVAHHTADDVYGVISPTAPRVTETVTIPTGRNRNQTVNRWQATGLYAAPGEVVTVTVPTSLVGHGYRIRINAHTDDISARDSWERMPVVHRSFTIDSTVTQVASAFGGSIFIDFGSGAVSVGDVPVTIAGAIRQPYFKLGTHTNDDWNNVLRDQPAPYGVLASDNLIIVLPKHQIESADLTKPHELMTWWNDVVRLQDELASQDSFRRSAEIINVDVQNSAGAAHAGFPIQAYERYWGNLADWDAVRENGSWGDFHELGHNHQRGWWTFDGDGEVTENVFANYALESLASNPQGGWGWSADPAAVIQEAIDNVSDGGTYSSKSNRWSFWFQLADGFGWETYEQVFATYEADAESNPGALPGNNQQEKDQWFTRWSNAVGYDMKRFMVDTWGLEVSQSSINAVSALPDWMPLATAVADFQVEPGASRTLDLIGGGLGMDGVAEFVGVSQPAHGTLTPAANGMHTYTADVGFGGVDSFDITYRSSAGNEQSFTVEIVIGNGFLPGDVNLDGSVNQVDVDQFILGWRSDTTNLTNEEKVKKGDLNLDGVTDFADWHLLRDAMAAATAVGSSAVLDTSTAEAASASFGESLAIPSVEVAISVAFDEPAQLASVATVGPTTDPSGEFVNATYSRTQRANASLFVARDQFAASNFGRLQPLTSSSDQLLSVVAIAHRQIEMESTLDTARERGHRTSHTSDAFDEEQPSISSTEQAGDPWSDEVQDAAIADW